MDARGRARFAAHFKVDYVFLVAYAAFGLFLGKNLLARCTGSPNL